MNKKEIVMNINEELIKSYKELVKLYEKELDKERKANKYLNDLIDRLVEGK